MLFLSNTQIRHHLSLSLSLPPLDIPGNNPMFTNICSLYHRWTNTFTYIYISLDLYIPTKNQNKKRETLLSKNTLSQAQELSIITRFFPFPYERKGRGNEISYTRFDNSRFQPPNTIWKKTTINYIHVHVDEN